MQILKFITYFTIVSSICFANEEIPAPKDLAEIHQLTAPVQGFCKELEKKFEQYDWGKTQCENFKWNHVRNSNLGTPLIWTVFGEENSTASQNTTIVLCGVHGDEITPIKFCWDLMNELKANHTFQDKLVVIAPLVAPDSFFKPSPSRTNGRGVDVNRNFPTIDWQKHAIKKWKQAHKSDLRKNPGTRPASEQETIFQMNLILRYRPNKVISVHAPLTLLDYDGPTFTAKNGKSAKVLLQQMSEKSSGYKISSYPVFPGSLGNWAGKEKHIPTYTLELPNSNNLQTNEFWTLFKESMVYAINHKMVPPID
jgi:protein MpaA